MVGTKRKVESQEGTKTKKAKIEEPTRTSTRIAKKTKEEAAAATKKAADEKKVAAAKKVADEKKKAEKKEATEKKAAEKKTTTTAKKASAKKATTTKKAAPKKAATTKKLTTTTAAKKATTAKKAPAKRGAPKKDTTAKKAPAKRGAPKKAAGKKASAKKAAAKKTTTTTTTTKNQKKQPIIEEDSSEEEESESEAETVEEKPTKKAAASPKPSPKKASTPKKGTKKATEEKEVDEEKETKKAEKEKEKKEKEEEKEKEKKEKEAEKEKKKKEKEAEKEKKAKEAEKEKERKKAEKEKEKKEKEAEKEKKKKDAEAEKEKDDKKEKEDKEDKAEEVKESVESEKEPKKDGKKPGKKATGKKAPAKKGDEKEKATEAEDVVMEEGDDKKRKAEEVDAKQPNAKKVKKTTEKEKKDVEAKAAFKIDVPFRTQKGDVCSWGSSEAGQLGLLGQGSYEATREKKRPTPINDLKGKNILKLEVGGMHNFIIVQKNESDPTDTELWSWGCNDNKVLGRATPATEDPEDDLSERPGIITELDGKHVIDITSGEYHSAALTCDGTLYLWGSYKENEGFLGYTKEQKPEQDLPIVYPPTAGLKFKQIASGHNHTLALTVDGKVLIWGYQVAWDGEKSESLVPREILAPGPVVHVFAGGYSNFVITSDDKVYAWGLNNYGHLGVGDKENKNGLVEVTGLSGKLVRFMAVGMHHTIALTADGTVYSFGRGDYGQLGTGAPAEGTKKEDCVVPSIIPFFSSLPADDRVIQIHGVDNHSVAVTASGKAFAWGFGESGQICNAGRDDDGGDSPVPYLIQGSLIKDRRILLAGAGGQHTAVVAESI